MIKYTYLVIYIIGSSLVEASIAIGRNNIYSLFFGRVLVAISMLYIVFSIFKNNPRIVSTLTVLILLIKFFNFIEFKSEIVYSLYQIFICIIFYMMGVYSSKIHNSNPIKQIIWLSIISLPILVMQIINWPDFVSYYNTQKIIDGVDKSQYFSTIFKSIDEIPLESGDIFVQGKPSGLTWSNAYTGFLLNLSLYLVLFLSPYKKNYKFIFICLAACIFCGSKVCIFGSFMLVILFIYKNFYTVSKWKLLFSYFFIILIYFLIFPALFSYNLSTDALSMSFLSRYYDALGWFGIGSVDETLDLISKNYSIPDYSMESFGSLSSFNYVIISILVILSFIVINFLFNKRFYFYLVYLFSKDYIIGFLLLIGIALSSTSLQFNSVLWFFSGFIFVKIKKDKLVIR